MEIIERPSPESADQKSSGDSPNRSRTRLTAVTVSLFVPGLGQWFLGAKRRALFFAAIFLIYCGLFLVLRFPKSYYGLVPAAWVLMGLLLVSGGDALRCNSPKSKSRSLFWLIALLPVALLSVSLYSNLLLRGSGFRDYNVPSTSMEGTIMEGDHLVGDLRAFQSTPIKRGDVVLFREEGLFKVKRVIAVGPCTITGRDNEIFINGRRIEEEYVSFDQPAESTLPMLANFGPVTVPVGKVFVMGDKRDISLDSRTFGPIDQRTVIGKALYIIRPLSRAGTTIQ